MNKQIEETLSHLFISNSTGKIPIILRCSAFKAFSKRAVWDSTASSKSVVLSLLLMWPIIAGQLCYKRCSLSFMSVSKQSWLLYSYSRGQTLDLILPKDLCPIHLIPVVTQDICIWVLTVKAISKKGYAKRRKTKPSDSNTCAGYKPLHWRAVHGQLLKCEFKAPGYLRPNYPELTRKTDHGKTRLQSRHFMYCLVLCLQFIVLEDNVVFSLCSKAQNLNLPILRQNSGRNSV